MRREGHLYGAKQLEHFCISLHTNWWCMQMILLNKWSWFYCVCAAILHHTALSQSLVSFPQGPEEVLNLKFVWMETKLSPPSAFLNMSLHHEYNFVNIQWSIIKHRLCKRGIAPGLLIHLLGLKRNETETWELTTEERSPFIQMIL